MATLIIYTIGAVLSILVLLFLLYHFVAYPIRTRYFRRHINRDDRCRFYIGDEKYQGYVRRIIGHHIEVEYYDYEKMIRGRRSLHVNDLYPVI